MKEVKVLYGQTLLDITIQELGDAERLFEVALLNGKGITDTINAGDTIIVPDYAPEKKNIVRVFSDNANKPASEKSGVAALIPEGIDYWAIGTDFIVS